MKKTIRLCRALDLVAMVALAGAAMALVAAIGFQLSLTEHTLLTAFRYLLIVSVGTLLVARVCQIGEILASSCSPAYPEAAAALPENVEALPDRERLARAA